MMLREADEDGAAQAAAVSLNEDREVGCLPFGFALPKPDKMYNSGGRMLEKTKRLQWR